MKKINITLTLCAFIATFALSLTSCVKDEQLLDPAKAELREQFVKKEAYGVYEGENAVIAFDKNGYQLYFSARDKCFRILTTQAGRYVEVVMSEAPEPGAVIVGKVVSKGLGFNGGDRKMHVLKRSEEKAWLWSDDTGVGYLVMYIE